MKAYSYPQSGLTWEFYGNATPEHIGYIPGFLNVLDDRPAKEQLHENYAHGGGWFPFKAMQFEDNREHPRCVYPGSPMEFYPAWARTKLRDETIYVCLGAWVVIVQPDGQYEIARMD